jgi:mono/diheme cytochrome c family protein
MSESPENQSSESGGFLKRLFTENMPIEQRSLLGTLIFFAIILAIGWVAINEPRRMETFTAQYNARSIQRGASIYNSNCSRCHGARGEGIAGVAPALNTPDLFNGTRLQEVGWAGSLKDYVTLTVSAGRPVRSANWPQPMPTWSQDYGGPMRPDEVQDVVNFVLNWGRLYEEGATPVATGPTPTLAPTPTLSYAPVGSDLAVALPPGDAARGAALFSGSQTAPDGVALGCQACHSVDGSLLVGPSMLGVSGRVPAGYDSPEAYLHEAIVQPCAYVVQGFDCVMPQTYGDRLDAQGLADLIAYLLTLR